MKNFKKIMALIVAMVMIVGTMSVSAFAAPGDSEEFDNAITISGLQEGDKVHIYQVLEWVGDGAADQAWGGWAVSGDFNDVIPTSEALGNIIDSALTSYTGITSALAGDLSRSARTADEITGSPFTVAEGKDSITVTPVALGTYMAIIEPADANIVYNPVFVSADYFTGEGNTNSWIVTSDGSYSQVNEAQGAAKKSEVELNKTFENTSDYNGDNGATAAVGDVITFTVTTTIPGYGDTFDTPAFVIKDSMDNLAFQSITSVTADGLEDGDYTVGGKDGEGNADATGYSITLKPEYLKTLAVPTELTIVYTAKVTEEAEIANIAKETNTVTLEFSHDPSTETEGNPGGDKQYKKDKTNHYTFSIDADNIWKQTGKVGESGSELIKISVDREGNPIYSETKVHSNITDGEYEESPFAGAKFTLYKVTGDGWTKGEAVCTDVVSDANGRIKFENLDAGKYILVETSAPTGFVRDTNEHHIEITSHESNVTKVEYYDQDGNWYDEPGTDLTKFEYEINELDWYKITFDGADVATHTFTHVSESTGIAWSESDSHELPASIHNTQGVELPSTGGMGTTLFYIIGAILVVGAGIVLVTRRRMSAN